MVEEAALGDLDVEQAGDAGGAEDALGGPADLGRRRRAGRRGPGARGPAAWLRCGRRARRCGACRGGARSRLATTTARRPSARVTSQAAERAAGTGTHTASGRGGSVRALRRRSGRGAGGWPARDQTRVRQRLPRCPRRSGRGRRRHRSGPPRTASAGRPARRAGWTRRRCCRRTRDGRSGSRRRCTTARSTTWGRSRAVVPGVAERLRREPVRRPRRAFEVGGGEVVADQPQIQVGEIGERRVELRLGRLLGCRRRRRGPGSTDQRRRRRTRPASPRRRSTHSRQPPLGARIDQPVGDHRQHRRLQHARRPARRRPWRTRRPAPAAATPCAPRRTAPTAGASSAASSSTVDPRSRAAWCFAGRRRCAPAGRCRAARVDLAEAQQRAVPGAVTVAHGLHQATDTRSSCRPA